MSKQHREKNTANKAKHSKLIAQKKKKQKTKELQRKAKLKSIVCAVNSHKQDLDFEKNIPSSSKP